MADVLKRHERVNVFNLVINTLTTTFLNHRTDWLNVIISQFEDIVKTIKHNLDDLSVLYTKQVAQWPYHTLTDDISHLDAHTNTNAAQSASNSMY